jgi:hypothetical protein
MTQYVLYCNCRVRTVLPPRSPLGIFDGPAREANPQMWPLRFVCQHCKCPSVRPAEDIRCESGETLVPNPADDILWRVQMRCDHKGCGRLFYTYTGWIADANPDDIFGVLRDPSQPVSCGAEGHPPSDIRMVRLERLGIASRLL